MATERFAGWTNKATHDMNKWREDDAFTSMLSVWLVRLSKDLDDATEAVQTTLVRCKGGPSQDDVNWREIAQNIWDQK